MTIYTAVLFQHRKFIIDKFLFCTIEKPAHTLEHDIINNRYRKIIISNTIETEFSFPHKN